MGKRRKAEVKINREEKEEREGGGGNRIGRRRKKEKEIELGRERNMRRQ
jgi:hypothetical protein